VPAEPFRVAAAVTAGIPRDKDRILLIWRSATGYRDGQLSLPAGHLDGGEDAVTGLVRELREEVGSRPTRRAVGAAQGHTLRSLLATLSTCESLDPMEINKVDGAPVATEEIR
jgi:8-oxo-dGTP pyrophosphatase MutT (NUDIX family)